MDNGVHSTSSLIVSSLRRISRSMDLHSRSLVQSHGLTGPQATLLSSLTAGPMTAGELANRINLSQGTVTDILNRLEARDMVVRQRDAADKRRVIVSLTALGNDIVSRSMPLMQDLIAERMAEIPEWEQSQLLAALQRIAAMMEGGAAREVAVNRIASGLDDSDRNVSATAA